MRFVLGTAATAAMVTTAWAGGAVSISGAVNMPGSFTVTESQTIQIAVREWGGFSAEADKRFVRITSEQGDSRTVDLTKMGRIHMVGPGDSIYVPKIDRTKNVVVRGGVAREGAYEVTSGMTVSDVLQSAGVFPSANLDAVRVVRTGTDGSVQILKENLLAMKLNPGDSVLAPHMGQRASSDRDLLTIALVGLILIVLFN